MAPRFPLSPSLTIRRTELGNDGEPVVTIDGMLADPAALVAEAATSEYAPAWGPAGGYPGLRAPASLDYVEGVARALLPVIIESFGLPPAGLARAECSFSLVTLPSDRLHATQRAPHVDTTDGWQFAILHYLCDARFGGTAFYRHRATGFEALTPERWPSYEAARAHEPDGQGYFDDGNQFEQIGQVDAAFDRVAIYRSRLLHSGLIPRPELLSDDPATGRLTANIFLTLRPKK